MADSSRGVATGGPENNIIWQFVTDLATEPATVPMIPDVSPDGARAVFLRSLAGDGPVNRLWTLTVATGEERLLADPVPVTLVRSLICR